MADLISLAAEALQGMKALAQRATETGTGIAANQAKALEATSAL